LPQAIEMITLACKLDKNDLDASFWRGIILFYYLHSKRYDPVPQKQQAELLKVIQDMAKWCEGALAKCTKNVSALFLLVKLLLMVTRESASNQGQGFGCGFKSKPRIDDCKKVV
jgi:hypothetical protein